MSRAELRIESLAAGGDGVAHLADGRVVFVPFTTPGDLVRVRLVETRARFARARVEELLEAGASRVAPACAVFGSCGGCAWQHVDYATQLEAKRAILRDAVRRIGGLREASVGPVLPSPSEYAYRGRARLRIEAGRVGFLRRRSHALCAVSRCPVLVPALDRRLHELASHPPQPGGEWELASGLDGVRAAPLAARGAPCIRLEVGGHRIRVSSGVFAQSNALMLDGLAARVGDAMGHGELAVELYAGAGLLTIGLAERFERVVAVEGDPAAVADLRVNLAEAAPERAEILAQSVEQTLPQLAARRPDALLLDPPRTGLPRDSAEALVAVEAQRIVYLSCDPATLARDLASICSLGYELHTLEGIDLFPQTPHIEALATLERKAAKRPRSEP